MLYRQLLSTVMDLRVQYKRKINIVYYCQIQYVQNENIQLKIHPSESSIVITERDIEILRKMLFACHLVTRIHSVQMSLESFPFWRWFPFHKHISLHTFQNYAYIHISSIGVDYLLLQTDTKRLVQCHDGFITSIITNNLHVNPLNIIIPQTGSFTCMCTRLRKTVL